MAIDKVTSAALETSTNQPGLRNIIINGDMSIAQRDTSVSSVTGTDATCDRWRFAASSAGTWTISQSTTVPTGQGFATSFKADCTTANGSLSAGSILRLSQFIEGQNLQYLKKGTSSAESLTMSFWVRSAKTGTYIINLKDRDNTRVISKSYTINSADTWEKKTITCDGDTTGAFGNDNDWSLEVHFYLVAGSTYSSGTLNTSWNSQTTADIAVGQVNLADSTSNDWYVTGVQLEVGTSASDFEFLPIDVNKKRCLRYYELLASGDVKVLFNGFSYTATEFRTVYHPQVPMRASPTLEQTSGSNYYRFIRAGSNDKFDDFTLDVSSPTAVEFFNSTDLSGTVGEGGWVRTDVADSYVALTSEFF
jgi:hypothetical protein